VELPCQQLHLPMPGRHAKTRKQVRANAALQHRLHRHWGQVTKSEWPKETIPDTPPRIA
jgi:hypothetical protein